MRERYAEIDSKLLPMLSGQSGVFEQNKRNNSESRKYSKLHTKKFAVSIYQNTDIVYFDEAVKGLEAQLKDLEKAQSLSLWNIMR